MRARSAAGRRRFWIACLCAATLATPLAAKQPQPELALSSLTVPVSKLPGTCWLEPVPDTPTATPDVGWVMFTRFKTNPWIGNDRTLLLTLRQSIDGPLKFPDAPPLQRGEIAALQRRWVADIVEGYRARYGSTSGTVEVSALKFNDPKLATTKPPSAKFPLDGVIHRLVVGAVVVVVQSRSTGDCMKAVDTYLQSLK